MTLLGIQPPARQSLFLILKAVAATGISLPQARVVSTWAIEPIEGRKGEVRAGWGSGAIVSRSSTASRFLLLSVLKILRLHLFTFVYICYSS
jgi:hypothetical protein